MARQVQIPGAGYANETSARQVQIPGAGYLNETVSTASTVPTLSAPTAINITSIGFQPRVTATY